METTFQLHNSILPSLCAISGKEGDLRRVTLASLFQVRPLRLRPRQWAVIDERQLRQATQ